MMIFYRHCMHYLYLYKWMAHGMDCGLRVVNYWMTANVCFKTLVSFIISLSLAAPLWVTVCGPILLYKALLACVHILRNILNYLFWNWPDVLPFLNITSLITKNLTDRFSFANFTFNYPNTTKPEKMAFLKIF